MPAPPGLGPALLGVLIGDAAAPSEQGQRGALVIGLPQVPVRRDAHAWIELAGRDVGPPPVSGHHVEIVRHGE